MDLVLTDNHRPRSAGVSHDIQGDVRNDQPGGLGDAHLHVRQRLRGDLRRVVDTAFVEGHAGDIEHLAKLVLDGLVCSQHDQADAPLDAEPVVELEGHVLPVRLQR